MPSRSTVGIDELDTSSSHMVEDETYLWGVSRYDHLNPVPVIVEHPVLWTWSS
jgi:hypothetical protein